MKLRKNIDIRLEHLDYVQIHPTTLYSEKPGRSFLISESVRGEGALLYDKDGERFVNELLPRDVVTKAIREQMEKDGIHIMYGFLWSILTKRPSLKHFPNIYERCLEEGYDVTKEWIPVVPAQHYFMGGIWVDRDSHTSMERIYYAVRRDQLQRCSWSEPSCKQFPAGKSGICQTCCRTEEYNVWRKRQ